MKKTIKFLGNPHKKNTSKTVIPFMSNIQVPYGRMEKALEKFFCSILIVMVVILLSACEKETSQSDMVIADVFTPTPQVVESTPVQTIMNDPVESFSSNRLGLCFSYPQGYTQIPSNDTVEIAAPDLPGSDVKGLFWLEISDSNNRTAEEIADEDKQYAVTQQGVPNENLDRWMLSLGGEQAVVLDGMPGQELQRRVYVVHQQTLYVLAFWPIRSENKAAGDQMEALYTTVTNSWVWSPCSTSE